MRRLATSCVEAAKESSPSETEGNALVGDEGRGVASPTRLWASRPPEVVRHAPSVRHRAHLRLVVVHADRLRRANLARQLVASGCEVVLVESCPDLATQREPLPDLALVDLGARNVDLLIEAMVARNPRLAVLGILSLGSDADETFRRSGVVTFDTVLGDVRGRDLVAALRRLGGL